MKPPSEGILTSMGLLLLCASGRVMAGGGCIPETNNVYSLSLDTFPVDLDGYTSQTNNAYSHS
ncbi:MAG: hypothetical protein LBM61_04385 [Prevotellaceae bacterium]|jgi:hypothetical protein|nr:hypothetical protein [Prevotellaceae bacterium]